MEYVAETFGCMFRQGFGQLDPAVEVGHDRFGVEGAAVMEGDTAAQGEGVTQSVFTLGPGFGEPGNGAASIWINGNQRFIDLAGDPERLAVIG